MDDKQEFARRVGNNLANIRNMRGLTQPDVAEKIGIGRERWNNVSNWECGYHLPPSYHLARLCMALDCSADYVFGFDDHRVELTADELWCKEHYRNLNEDQRAAIRTMISTLERSSASDG